MINREISARYFNSGCGEGNWSLRWRRVCRRAGEHTEWWRGTTDCTCFQFSTCHQILAVTVQTACEPLRENLSEGQRLFSVDPRDLSWVQTRTLSTWSERGISEIHIPRCSVWELFWLFPPRGNYTILLFLRPRHWVRVCPVWSFRFPWFLDSQSVSQTSSRAAKASRCAWAEAQDTMKSALPPYGSLFASESGKCAHSTSHRCCMHVAVTQLKHSPALKMLTHTRKHLCLNDDQVQCGTNVRGHDCGSFVLFYPWCRRMREDY